MHLPSVWIVRDPGPLSELVDVVFETEARRLGDYVMGAGPGAWERERHGLFTEKEEAVAEGIRRLVRVQPEREGAINREAHEVFGYGKPKAKR